MNDNAAVTANFIQVFVLTTSASPSEGGTLSPSGANGYITGAQVPVTASANSGYTFSNWSGDCTGSGSCLVTMDVGSQFLGRAGLAGARIPHQHHQPAPASQGILKSRPQLPHLPLHAHVLNGRQNVGGGGIIHPRSFLRGYGVRGANVDAFESR
jgi:hypothetical protein